MKCGQLVAAYYNSGMKRRISFKVLTGTETFDYHQLARKEHLKPVEVNLRMMEDTVKQIYNEYIYFKAREYALRRTTGKFTVMLIYIVDTINSRIWWIGIFRTLFVLAAAVWLVMSMKSFFIKKKLI